eukprot:3936761-Pyramimonas_sp.AAC.1
MDASSLFFVILMPCLWTISWTFSSMRVYEVGRRFSTATHSTNHFTMCSGLLRYSRCLWGARFRVLFEVECSFSWFVWCLRCGGVQCLLGGVASALRSSTVTLERHGGCLELECWHLGGGSFFEVGRSVSWE